MPRAEVSGATIHYEVAGEGEPLLLVPCLAADNACWALQLPPTTERFRAASLQGWRALAATSSPMAAWPCGHLPLGLHPAGLRGRRERPRVPARDEPVIERRGAPGRGLLGLVLAGVIAALAVALWSAPAASAAPASEAEVALARMYSPVVRLKEQPGSCDIGEPYQPTDIDLLMGNDEVALRGPWDRTNIVKVAPTARGPLAGALRLPPGLPRRRAAAGLHL